MNPAQHADPTETQPQSKGRRIRAKSKRRRSSAQSSSVLSTAARVLAIPEIAEMVIGYLNPARKRRIAMAGQVCRLWQAISQPILYRDIDLEIGLESRDEGGEVRPTRWQLPHGYKQARLYRLLCRQVRKRRLVQHLTVKYFEGAELPGLLNGCNALSILHLSCEGPFGEGLHCEAGVSLLEGVGTTLQELTLSSWWDVDSAVWEELLKPLERLERFTLEGMHFFMYMKSEALQLHRTVTTLILREERSYSEWSRADGLAAFLSAFTSLEHLTFSITLNGDLFPIEALPQTLQTLDLSHSDIFGHLEILRRLASPAWLAALSETPILRTDSIMSDIIDGSYAYGNANLPARGGVRRLIEDASEGLRKREGWQARDDIAEFWPDLLNLFEEWESEEDEEDQGDWGDQADAGDLEEEEA